jgi:hypothetical protein
MALPIKTVELPVFLKKRHELEGVLKKLEDVSEEAIDVIVNTMRSTESTPKMKTDCAEVLLGFQIKVSETISKDQLTRQIAEVKAKGLSTPLELAPGEKRQLPPRLDMRTIQSVN